MFSSTFITVALGAVVVTAATPSDVSSCSSGSASKYMSLADFPLAQSYCSDNYPSPATVTVTSCASSTAATYTGASKRDQAGHPQWRGDHGPPPPPSSREAVLFKKLMDQSSSTQSAFCSCIGTQPKVVTVQTTCDANEYCESDTQTCKIQRDCANPASCDGHSYCGKDASSGQNLFCHMDTDVSEMGYCMNDGPPNMGCPEPYEDCQSNADCGGKRVCIYSCCRAEPFCVDVRDYQNQGESKASRLLRRVMNPFDGR